MERTVTDAWNEELGRNVQRMRNFASLMSSAPPQVGCTPREEIYRKHKSRLYLYSGGGKHATPVLFVPNLGISRPYIFDLQPGASFIEYMTGQGFDFYLLDWGVFGPEDNEFTVDDAIVRILPRMARQVLQHSKASSFHGVGYCMGAPLLACYLATNLDVPVRSFTNMAGPIDFDECGMFRTWLDPRYFDADKFVDVLGQIPPELIQAGFKLLKPTMDVSAGLNLWWNLWNDRYVASYKALSKWANEYVGFPGGFFRQWIKEFYQQNRMYRGDLVVAGRQVRLKDIHCPVLAVGAKDDNIAPPACVRALVDAVGSKDKTYLELPGGHISLIAGRSASVQCWPQLAGWLGKRSAA